MSNRKPKPHITAVINPCRAFTLVELLLALIIFSIVALSLYGMFTNGIKVEAKAKYIHETYQEAYMAFDLLERELSNAIKYDFSGFSDPYSKYSTQTAFIGQSNKLTFLLPTAQGIDRVHYYAGPDGTVGTGPAKLYGGTGRPKPDKFAKTPTDFLMRQQMPLTEFLNQSNPAWQEEIISTGLVPMVPSGLRFAYASFKDQGGPAPTVPSGPAPTEASGPAPTEASGPQQLQWQDQWQQLGLPVAVRVTLTLFDPANPKEGVVLTREIYLPLGNW